MDSKIRRRFRNLAAGCVIFAWAPGCMDQTPVGDAANGALLFAQGDGERDGCQRCHCPDATGGCALGAPNIQGESFAHINARTRDPDVDHPGGKFDFTEQDVADIEAFLGTLLNGM